MAESSIFQSRGKACDNEWRILRELAKQQSTASALKDRLSQDKPITRYAFYTCMGRLRAWGWLRGHHTTVTVYTITDQGLRALVVANQKAYAMTPMLLSQELRDQEERSVQLLLDAHAPKSY